MQMGAIGVLARGAACLLALFAWTTPNHYPPWLTFHGELAMAVAALLVAVWLSCRRLSAFAAIPALGAVAILSILIPICQLAMGKMEFAGDVWMTSLYLLGFGLAVWTGHAAIAQLGFEPSVEPLAWTTLTAAIASSGIALYQWQGIEELTFFVADLAAGSRPYANLIQPNHLATLVVMGLLALAWLLERRRLGGPVALLVTMLLAFTLAMTQSRSGLAEVVFAAALLVSSRLRGNGSGKLGLVSIGVAVLVVFAMAPVWEAMRDLSPLQSGYAIGEMTQVGVRPTHWLEMLDAIGRHPWAGYGWNQLGAAHFLVAVDYPATRETLAHSHNLVLDLLIWNGLPIGAALVLVVALWFIAVLRSKRSMLQTIVLASIVAVFVHAMFEYPLYYAYFLLPTGALMGVLSHGFRFGPALRVSPVAVLVALALTAAALLLTAADYFRLESDVRQMRFVQARIKSAALEPSRVMILTPFRHFWNFALTREKTAMSAAELHEMNVVTLRFPSKENMLRYSAALALNGQPEDARQVLRRICRMNPIPDCALARRIWTARGAQDSGIAAVAWPED